MSLKKQAAKGGLWISITRTGVSVIDFLVFVYLARILSLEDFGLVAFCMLFIEFANVSINAGVNQNIVQRKTWDEQYASSTMVYVVGLAVVVASGLIFIGAPIAYYTYSHIAAYVFMSLAPITILLSLQVVFNGKLVRDFKNKQMGIVKFIASILSAVVIISLAELGYGLWSLVIGRLLLATLELLLLSYIADFKPKFYFNNEDKKELREFCLPLLGAAVLSNVNQKCVSLFTGLVLGPANFALLNAAKRGETMINQITMGSINSMVVPSFSRVKEGTNLGDLYIKLVVITATIVIPMFMGLAAIADPFVTIIFGDKFSESAVFMSISAFIMYPAIVGWFLPTLLVSQGKTSDAFKLTIISVTNSLLVAGCTIWFGISTMLICIVVANFLVLPIRFKVVMKHIEIDVKKLVVSIFPSYFCALAMFGCIMIAKSFLQPEISHQIILLVILIVIGCITYPALGFLFFNKHTIEQVTQAKGMFFKNNK
ncbi:oligosaccharide flippase family protein [Paraglaciecola chathamensis]|uniref:Lipopolysaccharide biosynthesis protein n=1 Tax=Paraglaciecola chathamensis TaxID=368405 RepID=A0A8H9M0Q3_9ALTE|nr:oligosaccharide flippase family protein [Paraglaciecola oceanifecundans]AEE24257.1 polysaccharide biosynthesis protein [Glaciecola sp. 4H-3-7+YE-5]GGZ66405.1 lipopolysaccharide biosynthesis protein [Paraglaciecola oceanifecundans]